MTRRPSRAPRRQGVGLGAVTVSGPRSGKWVGRAGGWVKWIVRAFAGQVGVEPGCEVRIGLREFGQHAAPEQRQLEGRGRRGFAERGIDIEVKAGRRAQISQRAARAHADQPKTGALRVEHEDAHRRDQREGPVAGAPPVLCGPWALLPGAPTKTSRSTSTRRECSSRKRITRGTTKYREGETKEAGARDPAFGGGAGPRHG